MKTLKTTVVTSLATLFFLSSATMYEASAQSSRTAITSGKAATTGQLIRAGRTRNGKPKFALLDQSGSIASYVVPASGLNLTPHLNAQVKITPRSVSRGRDKMPYILAQDASAVKPPKKEPQPTKQAPAAVVSSELPDSDSHPIPNAVLDTAVKTVALETPAEAEQDLAIQMPAPIKDEGEPLAIIDPTLFSDIDSKKDADSDVAPVGAAVLSEPALHSHEFHDSEYIVSDEAYVAPHPSIATTGCGSCNGGGCAGCADATNCLPSDCCPCGPSGRFWVRAEYMFWWTKGMDLPPLVTTSPSTALAENAGVLGQDTTVLFGGGEVLDSDHNGGRFRAGTWLDYCQWLGMEAEYFFISEDSQSFDQTSVGAPILARPFFNSNLDAEDSELIAYPGIVSGAVSARVTTELHSFTPRFRINLACMDFSPASSCGPCDGCGGVDCRPASGRRLDFLLGYRYVGLTESLTISEQLATTQNGVDSTFTLFDDFDVENDFHGAELGLAFEKYRGQWSLELLGRVALGNNHQVVSINGNTSTTSAGVAFSDPGGILALESNMGTYSDDAFAVIPEISATVGYKIGPNLRFVAGYTFFYWNNVVRPGEQIDLTLNPDLFPPVQATTGDQRPAFTLVDTDFWAQGISLGLDYRW